MNDVTVIDRFLATFSRYIDSGFGLLQGEVAFLTATLIVIDMTIAGLYWAMSHATDQGDDVIAKLLRKVLYVGAFAYIINNFNWLASIVFRSFAGLGLTASGSTMSMGEFLQPGRLAKTGIDAAAPILEQISDMAGFPEVFVNMTPIVVMFLAWAVVILCFFVLAIQLFITLIEFKLTTLAGFVLVPFALWNKTSFLAEKVLGNVVSSGIKVLVIAVVIGIGMHSQWGKIKANLVSPAVNTPLQDKLEDMTKLKPVFIKENGTVTAGNASGINDAAAAVVLMDAKTAQARGAKPLARLVSYAHTGLDPKIMGMGPVSASRLALQKAGLTTNDMDVIEANEAFAAQACAVSKELGLDPAKVNPNGSGISLGHPIGATGALITVKALYELQRINGKYALVTMCIGGGQGIAAIFERL